MTAIEVKFQLSAVAHVNALHHTTIPESAEPVAQPSSGKLEQRVAPTERTQNPPHRHHREAKLFPETGHR